MDLYKRLRIREVLHPAWYRVRESGLKPSSSDKTKKQIREFDANWLNNLEQIRSQLKDEKFSFTGEAGVALPKGKGRTGVRPLVVAPIANRIVRRAILDVLQGYGGDTASSQRRWAGVPAVREIMATPTSVGGIRERGVPHGLALIDQAVRNGKYWFVRSDIKDFFTSIPRHTVNSFIHSAVADKKFANLFAQALETNLENQLELEERHLFKLFPDPDIGVAQGSALSALAGNIALREFDAEMNNRGIVCVRYIDDFILLGPSKAKVLTAYRAARTILSTLGMDVYDLQDSEARGEAAKVDDGNIHDGTDVLGYRVSAFARQPSAKARRKFLEKLDNVVKEAKREMKSAAAGKHYSHNALFHQSMVLLHKIVWGWSQSFRHTTAKHVFEQLDKDIDKRIKALEKEFESSAPDGDPIKRRRAAGIHLLSDTGEHALPEI